MKTLTAIIDIIVFALIAVVFAGFIMAFIGCGVMESDSVHITTTPRYRINVYGYTEPTDKDLCFTAQIDDYLDRLGVVTPELTERLSVTINPYLNAGGVFFKPAAVSIRQDQPMLAIFGHELVRFVLWQEGDRGDALTVSTPERSGKVGSLWDRADAIAAEMGECQ